MEWNLLLERFFIRVNCLVWHRFNRKLPYEFATAFLAGNLFIVCLLKKHADEFHNLDKNICHNLHITRCIIHNIK